MRVTCLKMVHDARASHIGSALSICDIISVLYASVLKINPKSPNYALRDRFILSKGHACAAVYSALAELGFFEKSDLTTYGANFSRLMTHISHKVPGVEFSTGSLGHGLPFGVGKALAALKEKASYRVFVLLSDGELNEGSNWEAMLFASHHNLDNLIAIIDYNKLQSLKSVDETIKLEPLKDKFISFGWAVKEIDGHNHELIRGALKDIPISQGKPSVVIAHTIKGKGVGFMENSVDWHYKSPSEEELLLALQTLQNA